MEMGWGWGRAVGGVELWGGIGEWAALAGCWVLGAGQAE